MISEICDITPAWPEAMNDAQWHAKRLEGIGGSEVAALAGVSKYTSALELFAVKTGLVPHEVVDNEAIRWGKRLERPIAEEYAEREKVSVVAWPVFLRSRKYQWMQGNLDFIIVEQDQFPIGEVTDWKTTEEPTGILAILEIKTGGIGSHGAVHEWGTDESGESPEQYRLQVLHYQILTGIFDAYLVGLLGGHGLAIRPVPYDQDMAEYVIDLEQRFWCDHVLAGVAPEPDGSDSAETILKTLFPESAPGKEIDGGEELEKLWANYLDLKAIAEKAEADRKAARGLVVARLADAEYGVANGKRLMSYKSGKEVEYLDVEELKRLDPDIAKVYTKTRPGHRTLRSVKQ